MMKSMLVLVFALVGLNAFAAANKFECNLVSDQPYWGMKSVKFTWDAKRQSMQLAYDADDGYGVQTLSGVIDENYKGKSADRVGFKPAEGSPSFDTLTSESAICTIVATKDLLGADSKEGLLFLACRGETYDHGTYKCER